MKIKYITERDPDQKLEIEMTYKQAMVIKAALSAYVEIGRNNHEFLPYNPMQDKLFFLDFELTLHALSKKLK